MQRSFTINKANQTITFNNPGAQAIGSTPTLTATSSASLTVSFTSATTGVCTITTGGVLTTVAAGTCTINANQAGNTNYNAAPQVQQSFNISPRLTIVAGGLGSGTVTSNPTGLSCSTASCNATFSLNASVTLTAAASSGSSFANWRGSCSGTSTTATVTMDASKTCVANFIPSAQVVKALTNGGVTALAGPGGVAVDSSGNVFISDTGNHVVRKYDTAGNISIYAGTLNTACAAGTCGDGAAATAATLSSPAGLAVDGNGLLLIADSGNHAVRRVAADGTISTIAGTIRTQGAAGDGGAATAATLNQPGDVAVDTAGNILIADTGNHTIRRFTAGGNISRIAGQAGTAGMTGDAGAATTAQLSSPRGVSIDTGGTILVADSGNNAVRQFTVGGNLTTIAGTLGTAGTTGDGAAATAARLQAPYKALKDSAGNILILDQGAHSLRAVMAASSTIRTVGGLPGTSGTTGDDGAVTAALFNAAHAMASDSNGNLFLADTSNNRVRKVTIPYTLSVSVTGNGTVTSSPAGVNCSNTCASVYDAGRSFTLTATASTGSSFTGWGGDCSGTGTASVTLTANKTCSATFTAGNSGGTNPTTPVTPAPPPPFLGNIGTILPTIVNLITPGTGPGNGNQPNQGVGSFTLPPTVLNSPDLNLTLTGAPPSGGGPNPGGQTSVTATSDSGRSGTLRITITTVIPATADGVPAMTLVTNVSYDVASKQFLIASPRVIRTGARSNTTPATSTGGAVSAASGGLSAPQAAPRVNPILVTGPQILVQRADVLLTAQNDAGQRGTLTIPLTIYSPGTTSDLTTISLDDTGNFGTAASHTPVLSRNGQQIAFLTEARNVAGSGAAEAMGAQVVRYSVPLKNVELMSSTGFTGTVNMTPSGPGAAFAPALSPDGTTLAFASDATSLRTFPNGIRPSRQVYVTSAPVEQVGGTTISPRFAVAGSSGVPLSGPTDRPVLSEDGALIAFDSTAAELSDRANNGVRQVYRRRAADGQTLLVSALADGTPGNGDSFAPSMSDDGRYVLFETNATNLGGNPTVRQVFVKDMTTGALTLVSAASDGTASNGGSTAARLSGDGRFAVFESDGRNLITGQTPTSRQVYVKEIATGRLRLASAATDGLPANSNATQGAISGDGRFVVFRSRAGNLVAGLSPTVDQIFVRDIFAGRTVLISTDVAGAPGNGNSSQPVISGDGRVIAFASMATNLDGTQTNGVSQVYIAGNKILPPAMTGWWWNPAEPGSGYAIEERGNQLYVTAYSYTGTAASWTAGTLPGLSAQAWSGDFLRFRAGQTLNGAYRQPVWSAAGPGSLQVVNETNGTLTLGGTQIPVERFQFQTGGVAAGPLAGYPETGWWWNPAEGGTGVFVEVQGGTLFASIYAYTNAGEPVWYITQGNMSSTTSFTGRLIECSKPASGVSCNQWAGDVSLSFTTFLKGSITMPNGRVMPLTRFRF